MDLISIIISIGASVISGMALFFLQRYFKKKEKREAERDRVRRRENVLLMKSLDAVGKLTYANAIAIRDGKTNGEMHEAMESYNESKDEMYDYILEQNSKIIGGN
ncbi:MAG: hypothetical protein KH436_05570 [Firmicutes bacterium]|nr:hypothetical protein [Bacillota bacterium]